MKMVETKYRLVVAGPKGISRRLPKRYDTKEEARAAFRARLGAKFIEEFTVVNYPANKKIAAAMKAKEKDVLAFIRELNREGKLFDPSNISLAWWNALDRLKAKGLIVRFTTKSRFGYPKGYVARGFVVRRRKMYRTKYNRKPFSKVALFHLWKTLKGWGTPEMFGDEKLIGDASTR